MAMIERFNLAERVIHWAAAIAFVYTALSGLALWSPHLYWLTGVLGGGVTVRAWHPWGGVVFTIALAAMFRGWAASMRLDRQDRRWLAQAHRYAVHDEEGLPEAGRFNAGQKMLFWVQSLSTVLLLASGIVLWWPQQMPAALRQVSILIHPASAILSIGAIIIHIYMGTAAVPGAFKGMISGKVGENWAASHHPKWFRETSKR